MLDRKLPAVGADQRLKVAQVSARSRGDRPPLLVPSTPPCAAGEVRAPVGAVNATMRCWRSDGRARCWRSEIAASSPAPARALRPLCRPPLTPPRMPAEAAAFRSRAVPFIAASSCATATVFFTPTLLSSSRSVHDIARDAFLAELESDARGIAHARVGDVHLAVRAARID
mgnify:CR=1 FL=1